MNRKVLALVTLLALNLATSAATTAYMYHERKVSYYAHVDDLLRAGTAYVSHEGAVRFNEFMQALGSIPPATLAQRLADLEAAGIFEREVIDARPPRVEYRLTERGRQLRAIVNAVARFAETA